MFGTSVFTGSTTHSEINLSGENILGNDSDQVTVCSDTDTSDQGSFIRYKMDILLE